jgi:Fe2+ or Zn2+ uptake regulation protein
MTSNGQSPFDDNDPDYSVMTTADRLSHTHLNLLKLAWQKDRDELEIQKSIEDQLNEDISALISVKNVLSLKADLGLLHSNNIEDSHVFVEFMMGSLPPEFNVQLKCVVRSGDSWITIGI